MNIEFLQAAQMELNDSFNWYEAQQKNLGRQFIQMSEKNRRFRAGM